MFQCLFKGQAEGEIKINRQGQVRESKGIQRWIKRQRKDQVITEREGKQTDQESENEEAAASLPPLKTDGIL